MPFMVREILLVSTLYDSFILDEDGRFSEKLMGEYLELHLSSPPRMTRVASGAAALAKLQERKFDLVITMARISDMNPLEFARAVKDGHPDLPVALLAYDTTVTRHMQGHEDWSCIDRMFIWKGDSGTLLALVKSVEDMKNAPHDTSLNLVRVLIVVEDSAHYYSSFLPMLYTEVMQQTRSLIAGGINHVDRLYRMRARPKILLARNLAEADAVFQLYRDYVIGIITDLSLPKDGVSDPEAGLKFIRHVRADAPDLPVLLQSLEPTARGLAMMMNVSYANKASDDLLLEISQFIRQNCGFGDFVFRMPDGAPVARASNSIEMKDALEKVPAEALWYHSQHKHISSWLMARGKFRLALKLRDKKPVDYRDIESFRIYLVNVFTEFLERRQRGHIVEFSRRAHHLGRDFQRLGGGSLGGKGRGVAFIYKLLANSDFHRKYPETHILVPRTTVVCTNEYDRFVTDNNIRERLHGVTDDGEIATVFLKSRISNSVHKDLEALLSEVTYPLAVRSSSLLEDSQFQPFAGVYATYIIPNNDKTMRVRLKQLRRAIKLVYASTWTSAARAYMHAINHRVEEEKMGVLVQRLIGTDFGDRFYPTFSGVAQSYNYYPIRYMRPEDGIAVVALGLGRTVVSGGKTLRFSPAHPQILPHMSNPQDALRNTQTNFYALAMTRPRVRVTHKEEDTLVQPDLSVAEQDGALATIGATYSPAEGRVYDTIYRPGARLVNFAGVLKYNKFPLADLLTDILELGEAGMGCPVEMEFAVNLNVPPGERPEFAVLQIRPLVTSPVNAETDIDGVDEQKVLLRSGRALGNGAVEGIRDIVYVVPERFDKLNTIEIAEEVARINHSLVDQARPYVLIGPGRWGTSDPLLGVPVDWVQVSAARIIVETAMEGFDVDPSQGTHFFHNITSLRVGYLAVDDRKEAEHIDWDWLHEQKLVTELKYVRHVRIKKTVRALVDGKTGRGAVLRP